MKWCYDMMYMANQPEVVSCSALSWGNPANLLPVFDRNTEWGLQVHWYTVVMEVRVTLYSMPVLERVTMQPPPNMLAANKTPEYGDWENDACALTFGGQRLVLVWATSYHVGSCTPAVSC